MSDSETLQTVTHQALLSMGFSRQEYWSGLPCLPPGDLPDPEIEPISLMSPALAGGFFTTSATWEASERDKDSKSQYEQALGCMINGNLACPLFWRVPAVGLSQRSELQFNISKILWGFKVPGLGPELGFSAITQHDDQVRPQPISVWATA